MDNNKKDFYCEEVLSRKTKVEIVYESDNVLAFYHTKPSYKTHVVIIPKKHIDSLIMTSEKDNELILEIISVARDVLKNMNLKEDGGRLITNLGKFQDSSHLHFHIVSGEKIK